MTKTVLLASVVALFTFAGCSQQTAQPEAQPEVQPEAVAEVNKTVEKAEEDVQLVEEVVETPHSMKEMAVETVQTVK